MSDSTFTRVASDVPGAEGPVFDSRGRFFVVAPNAGQILEILADGEKRLHAETGGAPAGLQVDGDDNLWVADMKRGVLRVSPDGQVHDAVVTFEGQAMRGCNDAALDDAGNLYVTAPRGSSRTEHSGEIFSRTNDGAVHRLDGGYAFCNGIAVGADNSRLIVAETWTRSLWVYDILEPGRLGRRRLFATLPGEHEIGADGLDFDNEGHLLAANFGGGTIDAFDPHGHVAYRLKLPFAKPSNLHFGGGDGRDLYITEHETYGVWKTRWFAAGIRLRQIFSD